MRAFPIVLVAAVLAGPAIADGPVEQRSVTAFAPIHIESEDDFNRLIVGIKSTPMLFDAADGMLRLLQSLEADARARK